MSPCIVFPGIDAIVTVGGDVIRMDTAKGVVAFEWHDFFGPLPISLARGRFGNERLLPDGHPFWSKVTRWCEQGRQVKDGWAVVLPQSVCVTCGGTRRGKHLGGRHWLACTDCGGGTKP